MRIVEKDSNNKIKNWKVGDVLKDAKGDFYLIVYLEQTDEYTVVDLQTNEVFGGYSSLDDLEDSWDGDQNEDQIVDATLIIRDEE